MFCTHEVNCLDEDSNSSISTKKYIRLVNVLHSVRCTFIQTAKLCLINAECKDTEIGDDLVLTAMEVNAIKYTTYKLTATNKVVDYTGLAA